VVVWGVASEENEALLREYGAAFGVTYPILVDTDGAVAETYNQHFAFASAAYPQDWIVGTDGDIVYANNGFELDAMVAVIESELAE
jgi:peroxiredoxin